MKAQEIVIYGAGGNARHVAWLVESCNRNSARFQVKCYIDDDKALHGRYLNGIPVLSIASARERFPRAQAVGAVGRPQTRQKLVEKAAACGFGFATLVHPGTELSSWVEIGLGTVICAGNILTVNIILGKHVQINLNCTVGHDVILGDYCTLAPGVNVAGCVQMGKRVWVGTGATILNGTQARPIIIGDDAVIGAGACVTKSVQPGQTVVGIPARPLHRRTSQLEEQTTAKKSLIVVYGAGGHAKTTLATIEAEGKYQIAGVLDDSQQKQGTAFYGYQVLGGREKLAHIREQGITHAIVAIGDNDIRGKLAHLLVDHGFELARAVHPTATLLRGCHVGAGTAVFANAFIGSDAWVGGSAIISVGAVVGHDSTVKDLVHVGAGAVLAGAATVGKSTFLGVGSSVLPGVTIGRDVVVGAHALVHRDLPDGVTAVGLPARIIKR